MFYTPDWNQYKKAATMDILGYARSVRTLQTPRSHVSPQLKAFEGNTQMLGLNAGKFSFFDASWSSAKDRLEGWGSSELAQPVCGILVGAKQCKSSTNYCFSSVTMITTASIIATIQTMNL